MGFLFSDKNCDNPYYYFCFMKFSPLGALTISLLLGLLVTFVVDPMDPSTLSTPFCLGLVIMGLSFRQKTWVVATTCLIYCALVIYAMIHFLDFAPPPPTLHPWFWFFQRFGSFLVVCGLGTYLSYYREDTQRSLAHIQGILGKLPAPVVISDAAGYITYVNESLCKFFGQPAFSLLGKRYVDVFMTDIQEGKAMRYYIELFSDQSNTMHEVELKTSAGPFYTKGNLTCLGMRTYRSMVTVLQIN